MKKAWTLLVLGVWVAILPFLGFPYSWQGVLISLTGLALIYLSFVLYKEFRNKQENEDEKFDNFSENRFMGEAEL